MSEIKSSPKYEPLEFRVDLQAIDSFGTSEPKRVIYYAGDHEDSSEMAEIIKEATEKSQDEEPELAKADESIYDEPKVEEPKVEEATPVVEEPVLASEPEEENLEEAAPWKFIVKNNEKAKQDEAMLEAAKAQEALLAEDIINETLAQIKEKEVVEVEEPTIEIDTKKVDLNTEYGSGKIEGLLDSKGKLVALSVFLGVAVAVIVFIAIAMLVL